MARKAQRPKCGHWDVAEFNQFIGLTRESTLHAAEFGPTLPQDSFSPRWLFATTLSDIARSSGRWEDRRLERLKRLHLEVETHPVHKDLEQDENFREARRVFRRKVDQRIARYCDPYAEFRFLNTVVGIVVSHARHPNFIPKFPSRETARMARSYALKLLATMEDGIRLPDWREDGILRAGLIGLAARIETDLLAQGERKPRSDDSASQRWYLVGLARQLLEDFEQASPKIISAVAAMMGFMPDSSTIGRYVREAKRKNSIESAKRDTVS